MTEIHSIELLEEHQASAPSVVSFVGHQLVHEPDWVANPSPLIARAEGSLLWDAEGHRIIDGTSGLVNVNIGHGRREMAAIAATQIAQLDYFPLFNGSHPVVESLAAKLHGLLPHLTRFYFGNSGAEALETGLKLIREYWVLSGEPERAVVVAREGSYHGASIGALAATGIASRREPFAPLLAEVARLSRPTSRPGEDPEAATARLGAELRATIERCGPERVMAIVGEPIQLNELTVPPDGYWLELRSISQEYGIPLLADEILTGFGRTGLWFGLEHWGINADVVALSKGLSSGYAPISAVGISGDLADAFDEQPGQFFHHISTTAGHPVACALALENIAIIEREGLVERSAASGVRLLELVEAAFGGYACVAEIRGMGLLCAIRFDPAQMPDTGPGADARLVRTCLEHGAYIRADGGLLFAPPLTTDEETLEELVAVAARGFATWLEREHAAGR